MSRKLSLPVTMVLGMLLAVAWQLPAAAQPGPDTHPMGGVVAAGTASISTNPAMAATTITLNTQRAAIDWNSFDVGSQWSVNVQQPSSTSLALMRVTGTPNPTEIAGKVDSNGGVIIVNSAGAVVYAGSTLNDESLVLSAADVSDTNFMAGNLTFSTPGKPSAAIANQGAITVQQAGFAALLAPAVDVSGTITARDGGVDLLGAQGATLSSGGAATITGAVTMLPSGHTALVTLTGKISAPGGSVLLDSAAADGIVQYGVKAGGSVAAPSLGSSTGTIAVRTVGASVLVNDLLTAQGGAAAAGGDIGVNATGAVLINLAARLNVSGGTGGGVMAVGTTLAAATAKTCKSSSVTQVTRVAKGAQLNASGTGNGSGGIIEAVAQQNTQFAGAASATGGSTGGNGGYVAIGSLGTLGYTGSVDVSAPHGQQGTFILGC